MTVTKKDLALQVAENVGIKKQLAYQVVNDLFEAMRGCLVRGDRIEIRGFGVLGVKDTKPKPAARNPRTGEVVYVPARRKTYFKPGLLIRKELHRPRMGQEGGNQGGPHLESSQGQAASGE